MANCTVHLSSPEADYVRKLLATDQAFTLLVRGCPSIQLDSEPVKLDKTGAELLRDYFTKRLAAVGFDAEYKPNSEGRMLETLIDKFFLSL
jgi:hypothetical protein